MAIASTKDLPRAALVAGAFLALACGHSDPFSTPPFGTSQPFDPTPPIRLTLNEAADRGASWLPDGSALLYSAQQLGRADADVCLAELPPTGGSQRRLSCDATLADAEVSNAIESPAVSASGSLAFVKASSSIGGTNPSREAVAVAPGLDPATASEVRSIPYTIIGDPTYTGVTSLRWLSDTRLVYVGGRTVLRRACPDCRLDTLASGLKVSILELAPLTATPATVPGTDFASGVAVGSSPDEIYYTLGGDSRVFRRLLSTGEVSVVHDFGEAGIVRDVHVVGRRLAATVGGRVAFSTDPVLGPTQWDSGGIVHVVDIPSGSDIELPGPGLFRRPAFSPLGDRLVAEGYALIFSGRVDPITSEQHVDTTVSRAGDLYLYDFAAP